MQAVILAGGMGTRLGEITNTIPKPMVKINNEPLIFHIMKLYMNYGVKDFIICLGYKGEVIKDYFLNFNFYSNDIEFNSKNNNAKYLNKKKNNFKVKLINTGLKSGTAGRLINLKKYIKEKSFFLTYGDGLSNVDINQLYINHKKSKKLMTMTTVRPPGRFGSIEFKNGKIFSFNEKKYNSWINGGFFVLKKEILDLIKNKEEMLEEKFLQNLLSKEQVNIYQHKGSWQCLDTKRDLDYLNRLLEKDHNYFFNDK